MKNVNILSTQQLKMIVGGTSNGGGGGGVEPPAAFRSGLGLGSDKDKKVKPPINQDNG